MVGRKRLALTAVVALATAAVLAAVAGATLVWSSHTSSELLDLAGRPAALDPGEAPSSEDLKKMNVVDQTTERLRVPAVGLDAPLGALSAVDNVITPPGFASAYRVRNMGVPLDKAAQGTVYVVTHSLRGGGVAPGNYLFDNKRGKTTVKAGDQIAVGALTYVVDTSSTVGKSALPTRSDIWENSPGRLVLITCLQDDQGGPSTENIVILAHRA